LIVNDVLQICGVVLAITAALGVLDWLIVTRIAALYTSFDYKYFPVPLRRVPPVCLIGFLLFSVIESSNPSSLGSGWLLSWIGSIILYAAIIVLDIRSQRDAVASGENLDA